MDRRAFVAGAGVAGITGIAGLAVLAARVRSARVDGAAAMPAPVERERGAAQAMRRMSSLQLAREMAPGWNLGNTLEAHKLDRPYVWGSHDFFEQAWGNPRASRALFDAVRAAGFRSVRIPVAWGVYCDRDDNICPQWMARVTEVVNLARQAGLYVIVNMHWDGEWQNHPTRKTQAAANAKITRLWTQIARNFRDHDDYLLFAGACEVGMAGAQAGAPRAEWLAVQNGYNQAFVSAVRATGGNNALRHLVVPSYKANIDLAYHASVLPADTVAGRLMMEVHYFDPCRLTIDDTSGIWQWGVNATEPSAVDTWANEAWVDVGFQRMQSRFIGHGIPVLLGEYGIISKAEHDPSGAYRLRWVRYVTGSALQHGLVPMWWDNGCTGNHGFGLFDRNSGAQVQPALIAAIVGAARNPGGPPGPVQTRPFAVVIGGQCPG
jgi:endoglucanase